MHMHTMTRRQALRRLGGLSLAAACSLVAACQPTPGNLPAAPSATAPAAAAKPTSAPTTLPAATTAPSAQKPTAAPAAPVAAKQGGQATMGWFRAIGSALLGDFASDSGARIVNQIAFDSLLQYDDKLAIQPRLAESWE